MIAALLLLVGCGMSEARFQRRADEETCAWMHDCFGDNYDACLSDAEASWAGIDTSNCSYDPGAARDCVDGLEELDCPQDDDDAGFPYVCTEVWACR